MVDFFDLPLNYWMGNPQNGLWTASESWTKFDQTFCIWVCLKRGGPQNDHINLENKDWHALTSLTIIEWNPQKKLLQQKSTPKLSKDNSTDFCGVADPRFSGGSSKGSTLHPKGSTLHPKGSPPCPSWRFWPLVPSWPGVPTASCARLLSLQAD